MASRLKRFWIQGPVQIDWSCQVRPAFYLSEMVISVKEFIKSLIGLNHQSEFDSITLLGAPVAFQGIDEIRRIQRQTGITLMTWFDPAGA